MTQVIGQQTAPIDHSTLVSDISRQFPQCRPVFEKYGIAGCGGQLGPPEPLFIFAAAHRVPLRELVDELNGAVRGEWKEDRPDKRVGAPTEEKSETLYKRFVFAALFVALTAGFTLGAINLTRIAVAKSSYEISGVLKQVHAHAQLFGWVALFIMGVALHAVPRFKMVGLKPLWAARACFASVLAGVLLRAVAQPLAASRIWSAGVAVSGLLELLGIALFISLLARVIVRSQQPREFYETFIWASVGWLATLGAWNSWLTLQMFLHKSSALPALANALFVHAALFGFMANMIFGFSLRVLPHFLGLREPKPWAAKAAFALWNAAILLRYPIEKLAWVASTLELVAVVSFVYALGIFARRRIQIDIKGVDNTFARFIYLGYGWLLLAAVQPFHADIFRLTASARHAMTVGFVTSIMMGVGYRVLPVFNGVNLYSTRLMRVSFWLQAAGSTLTIAMALNAAYGWTWTYVWSAAAGWLVLTALVMFAVNIAMTLRQRREAFTRDTAVTRGTRVGELLAVWPELRPALIHGGLSGLAAMRHAPPSFVTIEFAARRHGIHPAPLVAALNEEISRCQGMARPPGAPQPVTTADGPAVRPYHDPEQRTK